MDRLDVEEKTLKFVNNVILAENSGFSITEKDACKLTLLNIVNNVCNITNLLNETQRQRVNELYKFLTIRI